jgi:tRNA-binding EMAP/Myf-like protein
LEFPKSYSKNSKTKKSPNFAANSGVPKKPKKFFLPTSEVPHPFPKFSHLFLAAVITSVTDHPSDENLFLIQVSLGNNETRQVVARLKSHYKKDQLENRHVVALCNLPPAEIKGTKSEAMLLVAEKKKGKETESVLLSVEKDGENILRMRD